MPVVFVSSAASEVGIREFCMKYETKNRWNKSYRTKKSYRTRSSMSIAVFSTPHSVTPWQFEVVLYLERTRGITQANKYLSDYCHFFKSMCYSRSATKSLLFCSFLSPNT